MDATASEPSPNWQDLIELAARREGERALVLRLLEVLKVDFELDSVALYAESADGFVRRAALGSEPFPSALERQSSAEPGYAELELPGARVLYVPRESAARQPPEGPVLLALSTALQASSLRDRLKQQKFEVNYRGVELEALYDVGLGIAAMRELEQLGEEILLRAVSLLDARRGAFYVTAGDSYRLDHTFGGEALPRVKVEEPQVLALLASQPVADQNLLPGASHVMAVPIGVELKTEGLLVVADKESRVGVGPFPPADRRTLSLFANQASIALENARLHKQALEKERLERELELAADIQRRLLPIAFPKVEGYEIIGWNRPARHVGGDYYDLMRLSRGTVAAVLADVSGKGMPASLMVSTVYSALRLLLDDNDVAPALLERINHHIAESSAPNKFITLLVAELDPKSGHLDFVNAGHNPGLLLRESGAVEELEAGGMPLGLFDGGVYKAGKLEMAPGDLLCIYSDGITECASPEDEEFGPQRLVDLLLETRDLPLAGVVKAVDRSVTQFARGLSQGDDQTLVLIRRTG